MMSMPPSFSSTAETMPGTCASSSTSPSTVTPRRPASVTILATLAARSSTTSTTATSHPARARQRAVASPIPCPPPNTTAHFPSRPSIDVLIRNPPPLTRYPASADTASDRKPLLPPQQLQPPKCRAPPPGCQEALTLAGSLVPAPRLGTVSVRWESSPQPGQGCGAEYSAMGRVSANPPHW